MAVDGWLADKSALRLGTSMHADEWARRIVRDGVRTELTGAGRADESS